GTDGGDHPPAKPGHRGADAADPGDRRAARVAEPADADLEVAPDRDRIPHGARRSPLAQAARPPGERRGRATGDPWDLRRGRRVAEVVRPERRREVRD